VTRAARKREYGGGATLILYLPSYPRRVAEALHALAERAARTRMTAPQFDRAKARILEDAR
jgi:hypothetical protein